MVAFTPSRASVSSTRNIPAMPVFGKPMALRSGTPAFSGFAMVRRRPMASDQPSNAQRKKTASTLAARQRKSAGKSVSVAPL